MLQLPGLRTHVPLAPYTTYQIGGPADYLVTVESAGQLVAAVRATRVAKMPYCIIGTGANILIADSGFRGLAIINQAAKITFQGTSLIAESGVTIAQLIDDCAARGLSGLEHFAGIPSSVGGALWQNLHFLSPDRQRTIFIAEIVKAATILDKNNAIRQVDRSYLKFGYDDSLLHHQPIVVLDATFILKSMASSLIERQMETNLVWREERQPQLRDFPSCGSVFKRIDGVGAGRLIEAAGLKGHRIGQAQISEQHANYILNLGNATAADVRALIHLVQQKVKHETDYLLEPEIGFVGED